MNKMFTTAMAIAAVAGLASADISTTAGYKEVSVTGSDFIGTPFANYEDSEAAATLGDIIGQSGDSIKVISAGGKTLFTATYGTSPSAGWYDGAGCSNAFPLARGTSVHFTANGDSSTLFMAGSLATNDTVTVNLGAQNNFVANASPFSAKTLGNFVVSGAGYKPMGSDYFFVNGQKVVYLDQATAAKAKLAAGWYLKDALKNPATAVSQNGLEIPVGKGFRCVLKTGATITVPGK